MLKKNIAVTLLFLIFSNLAMAEKNLISNGEFKGLDPWKFKLHSEYQALVKQPKCKGSFSTKIPYTTKSKYAALSQELPAIREGKNYTLTFEARVSGEGSVTVGIGNVMPTEPGSRKKSSKQNIGCKKSLSDNGGLQPYEVNFTAQDIASSSPQIFSVSMGSFKGEFEIKNISLVQGGSGGEASESESNEDEVKEKKKNKKEKKKKKKK